jgi:hypothetical protein
LPVACQVSVAARKSERKRERRRDRERERERERRGDRERRQGERERERYTVYFAARPTNQRIPLHFIPRQQLKGKTKRLAAAVEPNLRSNSSSSLQSNWSH